MTITLQAVNELIASLESAGELSIKETKVMALANAYQQLAAENVALKNVFGPGDAVLNFLTIALRHTTYDQIDLDDVSLAFKMSLPETPATDRIVAGIKADGVEEMASTYRGFANKDGCSVNMKCSYNLTAERAESYAAYIRHQMREGADK
ncbi:hypothetical protein [Klebsiella quasipneumoniae]|uniref:hypothetical protein n=1 Tax=Klebsiella quasipneumoniae TaxID=1463165 RepID=UPI00272EFE6C|nr:hypothetical protein [Klebsiella quasipneumoniae]MDP0940550.1 hypothetical protein [Klebsiella quasipneumoniae]MDP1050725.1 hypothetical protein [Klebsiella quasipneumoniae]